MNTVLVPYTDDSYLGMVFAALDGAQEHGWQVCTEPLGFGPDDYWHCLCRWWDRCARTKTDLMIVEHDIVAHADVLSQFGNCPEPMCAFTYWLGGDYGYGLGCTRFRASLVCATPDAVERAGRTVSDGLPVQGHWKRMDTRMWQVLGTPHVHEPPVRHLHTYPMEEPCEQALT